MNTLDSMKDASGKLTSYAWPGGYPVFYLDRENSVLCASCATSSLADDEIDKFKPVASGINWEDADMSCDQCSRPIESAYAQD